MSTSRQPLENEAASDDASDAAAETGAAEENMEQPAAPPSGVAEALAAFQQDKAGQDAQSERVAALEQEVAELRDALLRSRAEMENMRRRTQKETEEAGRYAVTAFARDLVNVIENLNRASEAIPEADRQADERLHTIAVGIDMTRQEFLSVLERHGIRRLDPIGEKFDHHLHQAVVEVPDPNAPPGVVVQVVQAGYVIHDRLLRPAMVGVSKAPPAAAPVDTQA